VRKKIGTADQNCWVSGDRFVKKKHAKTKKSEGESSRRRQHHFQLKVRTRRTGWEDNEEGARVRGKKGKKGGGCWGAENGETKLVKKRTQIDKKKMYKKKESTGQKGAHKPLKKTKVTGVT